MRKKIMAGNWKMNNTIADLVPYFDALSKELTPAAKMGLNRGLGQNHPDVGVVFAVPFLQLYEAKKAASVLGKVSIAAQNVHFEASGAYTGEISVGMLAELGVSMTLIGHSERRQYFNETDETVVKKVKTCLAKNITPIICVGETKEERIAGITNDVLSRQVGAVFSVIDSPVDVVIAYEPVWAIGTGLTATKEQAQDAHAFIRNLLLKNYGPSAHDVSLLYGGSASPQNIEALLQQKDIDGGLVGGASLKPMDFAKMINIAFSFEGN